MTEGKIKFFNQDKGYGFIKPDDGSEDVFIHISSLKKSGIETIETNQRIKYMIGTNNKNQSSAKIIELI